MCEDGSLNHEETLDFDPELQANASERVIERRPKSEHRTQGLSPGEAFPDPGEAFHPPAPFAALTPVDVRWPARSSLPCHRSSTGPAHRKLGPSMPPVGIRRRPSMDRRCLRRSCAVGCARLLEESNKFRRTWSINRFVRLVVVRRFGLKTENRV